MGYDSEEDIKGLFDDSERIAAWVKIRAYSWLQNELNDHRLKTVGFVRTESPVAAEAAARWCGLMFTLIAHSGPSPSNLLPLSSNSILKTPPSFAGPLKLTV
ncbi:MAG: hypothetical protein R3F19_19630 [Verrucomicrobiales bacterium]